MMALSRKSVKRTNDRDKLRSRYRRGDLGKGVRGKYFAAYQKGTNLVLLNPDIAKAFPTSEAVNEALRGLLELTKTDEQADASLERA